MYTKTFRVNFAFANPEEMKLMSAGETSIYESKETLLLRICALHRIQPDWTFDDYMVKQIVISNLFTQVFSDIIYIFRYL